MHVCKMGKEKCISNMMNIVPLLRNKQPAHFSTSTVAMQGKTLVLFCIAKVLDLDIISVDTKKQMTQGQNEYNWTSLMFMCFVTQVFLLYPSAGEESFSVPSLSSVGAESCHTAGVTVAVPH